jgi:predicted phage terminase large subunit-like protein
MPPEKSPDTVHEPLRSYSLNPHRGWLSVKYRAHDEDFSHILWPEQFSEGDLKRIRQGFVEMGMLDIYGQEYLNNPIDESVSYYRKSDFRPMTDEMRKMKMTYYATGDLAIGENKRSAYTAFVVGGMNDQGDLCIVDVRRDRLDGLQIVEEMFSINTRWNPDMFRLEEENIARSIGSFLHKMMDERQTYLPLDTRTPSKDKDKRSRGMQARCRAGKVYVDMEAEWAPDFIEELIRYPKHPFKDQFDAFGWLGLMMDEMVQPLTPDEAYEDDYMAMVNQARFHEGRDSLTGY